VEYHKLLPSKLINHRISQVPWF